VKVVSTLVKSDVAFVLLQAMFLSDGLGASWTLEVFWLFSAAGVALSHNANSITASVPISFILTALRLLLCSVFYHSCLGLLAEGYPCVGFTLTQDDAE
jgi:hypothetical protein